MIDTSILKTHLYTVLVELQTHYCLDNQQLLFQYTVCVYEQQQMAYLSEL